MNRKQKEELSKWVDQIAARYPVVPPGVMMLALWNLSHDTKTPPSKQMVDDMGNWLTKTLCNMGILLLLIEQKGLAHMDDGFPRFCNLQPEELLGELKQVLVDNDDLPVGKLLSDYSLEIAKKVFG